MAGDLQALREECAELSTKRFRAAVITLVALFIAVLAFTRAFRRIDRAEVQEHLQRIAALSKAADTNPVLSYIFSEQWEAIRSSDIRATMPEPINRSPEQRALAAASDELERLAASWFSVRVPLGGPEFELDLRYWFAILPFILWTAFAYHGVIGAKLRVARRAAAAQVTAQSDVLDRLTFSGVSAYARYPDVLGHPLYLALVFGILGYFVYASLPFWKLLLGEDHEMLSGLWLTGNLLVLITAYVALLVWSAQSRIERHADAILGSEGPPFAALRLLRLVRRAGSRVVNVANRAPRMVVTLGAAAILISPFTMIATTCDGVPRTGMDLLRDRNDAKWFTEGAFLSGSMVPDLGRWFYAATLLLALVAVTSVLLSLTGRVSWPRTARRLRPFAAVAALYMLLELSLVFLAMVFFIMDAVRILAFVTPVVVWLRHRRRERWRDVLRPRLEVLLLPTIPLAVATLVRLPLFGLTGLPIYSAGLVVLMLPLLAPQEAEEKAAGVIAPAVVTPSG